MPDAQLTTAVGTQDGVTVLTVAGDVDLLTAPLLQDAIDSLLACTVVTLIIDLTDVAFLGSVGLRILAETDEKTRDSTPFAVVAEGAATERPIRLTGLDSVLTVCSTVDAAVAAVRARARQAAS